MEVDQPHTLPGLIPAAVSRCVDLLSLEQQIKPGPRISNRQREAMATSVREEIEPFYLKTLHNSNLTTDI